MSNTNNDDGARSRIALWLVFFGTLMVLVLAVTAIALAYTANDEPLETVKFIFTAVLPLIGTWVGTVLAFYFAKDNFESATRSARELLTVEERLRATRAKDASLAIGSAECETVDSPEAALKLKAEPLVVKMQEHHRNRLPIIVQPSGLGLYIIHLSTLTEYLLKKAIATDAAPKTLATLTLADCQKDEPALFNKIKAIAYIRAEATLADAKAAMGALENCADVFLTANGRKDERVIAWLTNRDIEIHSQA